MVRTPKGASGCECVLRVNATVGESPVWDSLRSVLYWVDIAAKAIHRFDPERGVDETFELPDRVTSLGLRRDGSLIVTLSAAFAFFDPDTNWLEVIQTPEPDLPANRFNDGKCDRRGRFWAGTMNQAQWDEPSGSLYRCDPDLRATRVLWDVVCSNGLGWSPDDQVMYHTESFRHHIYAFDFDLDSGTLSNQRLFLSLDERSGGFPDGLTVDADGCVWSAQPGLGRVARYTPGGRLDRVIELPVPRPTSCVFGGERLDVLYITSATETLTDEHLVQAPLSGGLFAVVPGVRGLPEPRFAG